MNSPDLLFKQTRDPHSWAYKMIECIPMEQWDGTPDTLASNISRWVGHHVINEYYRAILVVTGFDEEITQRMDIKAHNQSYVYESISAEQVNHSNPEELRKQLHLRQKKVIQNVSSPTLTNLDSKGEKPIKQKHSLTPTKSVAISSNSKHTIWHCGQIASIKRLIHGGFDFGLPRRT